MDYTNNEVLFTKDDWAIIRDATPSGVMAYHIKCSGKDGDRRMSWLCNETPTCHYCDAEVPDDIQTLVHLYTGW